jgi:hypothetical protein
MNQVKDHFKEINEFQPNLSLFDQAEETSIFGSIKFNQYTNTNLFHSQILTDVKQYIELIELCNSVAILITLAVSKCEVYRFFRPKIDRSANRVKSAHRPVFKIKTTLALRLIYFKKRDKLKRP